MNYAQAVRVIENLEPDTPWYRPSEFANAMAAFVAVYRDEVDRKTHLNSRKLYAVLWSATAHDRCQWYFNAIRGRHYLPERYRYLVSSGTSSVESLNHEMNSWFSNLHDVYAPTLRLELRINKFFKLLTHNTAMYRPQLRQLSQQTIAAASHDNNRLSVEAWRSWCASDKLTDALHIEKQRQRHIVSSHEAARRATMIPKPAASGSVYKRPAASGRMRKRTAAVVPKAVNKHAMKQIKRHAFNLKRIKTSGCRTS